MRKERRRSSGRRSRSQNSSSRNVRSTKKQGRKGKVVVVKRLNQVLPFDNELYHKLLFLNLLVKMVNGGMDMINFA